MADVARRGGPNRSLAAIATFVATALETLPEVEVLALLLADCVLADKLRSSLPLPLLPQVHNPLLRRGETRGRLQPGEGLGR